MNPLSVAIPLLVISVVALAVSRALRGRRRLGVQRVSVFIAVPSFTAVAVLLPLELDATFSDALSVAGLVLSLLLGVGAKFMDVMSMRMRVGIVIPSRVPFHTDLRRGFNEALIGVRAEVYDDYLTRSSARENLAQFIPSLRRVLEWRPDYLVVCSPSVALLSTEPVISLLRTFSRRGGGIVFLDNEPDEGAREQIRHHGCVRADVERAATLLGAYVQDRLPPDGEVLVLCGPPSSDPALRYQRALEGLLPPGSVVVADSSGWTEEATYTALLSHLERGRVPSYVLCGNDVMAFGAVRAVREKSTADPRIANVKVVGYNGISRALFAIAEPGNPLSATVCLPPAAYGQEAAAMLISDSSHIIGRSRLHDCCMPIGEGQIIDRSNVELVLED